MTALKKIRRYASLALLGAAATTAAVSLVACGGGKRDPFVPTRLVVFGDESGFMRASDSTTLAGIPQSNPADTSPAAAPGQRYTVNQFNDGTTYDGFLCGQTDKLTWFQHIALHYGMQFAECIETPSAPAAAETWATESAKVADVTSAINAFPNYRAGFNDKDLVAISVGANDIKEAADSIFNHSGDISAWRSLLRARGQSLVPYIKAITDQGAHVVLLTVLDLGLTPYATAQNGGTAWNPATPPEIDCESAPNPASLTYKNEVLSMLTACFNIGLRSFSGSNFVDGRVLALVRSDVLVRTLGAQNSVVFGHRTDPLCPMSGNTLNLNQCRANSHDVVVSGVTVLTADTTQPNITDYDHMGTYLWAGDVYLSHVGQTQLASWALSQIHTNFE